jgi:diguanylate cyclase (GGDEF)-like protein
MGRASNLSFNPVRVLLVEDNLGDAELLRRSLAEISNPRFELTQAPDLSTALGHARGASCDAVLLDLSLPDSRGVEAVRALALALPRIPILVLTGMNHDCVAMEALRRGAQDYLVKGTYDGLAMSRSIRYAIERKAFEAALVERANFDSLTGLVNRALFRDRLDHALTRASRARTRIALMFVDLDGFKAINDTLGHEIGDEVLKCAAGLLGRVARKDDTVARLGGDEFTVILEQIDDTSDALVVAKRILRAFGAPLVVSAREVRVTCSIGVAVFPDSAADAESLLRHADAAMFRAKHSGRNQVQLFDG